MFPLHVLSVNGKCEILRHDPVVVDNFDTGRFEIQTECSEWLVSIELGAMEEAPRPSEYGSDRVGRGFFSLLVFTVVAGHSTYKQTTLIHF